MSYLSVIKGITIFEIKKLFRAPMLVFNFSIFYGLFCASVKATSPSKEEVTFTLNRVPKLPFGSCCDYKDFLSPDIKNIDGFEKLNQVAASGRFTADVVISTKTSSKDLTICAECFNCSIANALSTVKDTKQIRKIITQNETLYRTKFFIQATEQENNTTTYSAFHGFRIAENTPEESFYILMRVGKEFKLLPVVRNNEIFYISQFKFQDLKDIKNIVQPHSFPIENVFFIQNDDQECNFYEAINNSKYFASKIIDGTDPRSVFEFDEKNLKDENESDIESTTSSESSDVKIRKRMSSSSYEKLELTEDFTPLKLKYKENQENPENQEEQEVQDIIKTYRIDRRNESYPSLIITQVIGSSVFLVLAFLIRKHWGKTKSANLML